MDKTARARRRRTPEQTLHARIREAVSSLLSPSDSDNSSFYERRSPPSFPRRREFSDLKFPGRQPRNPWVFPENQPCHSYDDAPAAYSYTHFGSGDGGNRPKADTGETVTSIEQSEKFEPRLASRPGQNRAPGEIGLAIRVMTHPPL